MIGAAPSRRDWVLTIFPRLCNCATAQLLLRLTQHETGTTHPAPPALDSAPAAGPRPVAERWSGPHSDLPAGGNEL